MLRAKTMPRAHNTALEQAERGFDGVGVNIALHVDSQAVPDSLVPSVFAEMPSGAAIGFIVIGKEHVNVIADILADVLFKRSRAHVLSMKESQITATLTDADDDFLVVVFRCVSLTRILSANVGFIHFDFSTQFRPVRFDHRGPDAMAEIPRGFVADSKHALNLIRRDSLARFAHDERDVEPDSERQMGIVKHCSGSYRKLVAAIVAVKCSALVYARDFLRATLGADDAARPAQVNQAFPTPFIGSVLLDNGHQIF